jgi:hypothetical protein
MARTDDRTKHKRFQRKKRERKNRKGNIAGRERERSDTHPILGHLMAVERSIVSRALHSFSLG